MRTHFATLFLVGSVFFLLIRCGGKDPGGGRVGIEEIDGVATVRSPDHPVYGEIAFDLVQDISIGGDVNQEPCYFPKGIRQLIVDENLNVYVVDPGNRRIQKYDREGGFLATIGRCGQGPGEYSYPSSISLDSRGRIWVMDLSARAVKAFSAEGQYLHAKAVDCFLSGAFVTGQENVFGEFAEYRAPEGPRTAFVRIDPESGELQRIAEFRWDKKASQRDFGIHFYSPQLAVCRMDDSDFGYGFSNEYRITLSDGRGESRLVIEKDEAPAPITEKEKQETARDGVWLWTGMGRPDKVDLLDFPDHRPFFRRILADDHGRLYVVRFRSIFEKDGPVSCDVFGKDGVFLYRLKLPFLPEIIRYGYLYEIHTEEATGEVILRRHKIRNWNVLPSE